MTTYIAAYDTESPDCLPAVRQIVEIHRKHQMPATFFIVARLLDQQGQAYRSLIGDDPLFEVASHSYTHMLLFDHRVCGKAGPRDQYEHEIVESKQRIEACFEYNVIGFRPAVGSSTGLRGKPELLGLCRKAGYQYSSSLLWGPEETMPALLHAPHPMPEAARTSPVKTPREEFDVHRLFVDKAMQVGAGSVSLVWHPWSLRRFDPQMTMLEWLFSYIGEKGLPVATFADYVRTLE
jgi:peptidoglycan/xylan/chitin deacetylase (PgdA/CDA1 family)